MEHRMIGTASAAAVLSALILAACGGAGGGSASTTAGAQSAGTVSVALTDAPGLEYDHVWVTVRDIWFHTSDAAGPNDAGWLKFPLAAPVTVDLATLTNGAMATVFNNLSLPAGNYQQIRVLLEPTLGPLTASAKVLGLNENNEVVYNGTANAPLHIAGFEHGLALIGNFTVSSTAPLSLAVDFDLDHDIVKFLRGSRPEFILKPRLRYFDLTNAGAIIGKIDPSVFQSASNANGGYNFVIKAEEPSSDGTYHVVPRATTVKPDGSFVLYPVPANKNGSARNYDVLIRGRNIETHVIKTVPVMPNSSPTSNPTTLTATPIKLTTGTEYNANLSPALNPTGGWSNFYQTVPVTGEVPYEVRFRHTNPFTGQFTDPIALSLGNLFWANYNAGLDVTFTAGAPVEGAGKFTAVADAPFFARGSGVAVAPPAVSGSVSTFAPGALSTVPGVSPNSVSGNLVVPAKYQGFGLDTGYLIAVRDGYRQLDESQWRPVQHRQSPRWHDDNTAETCRVHALRPGLELDTARRQRLRFRQYRRGPSYRQRCEHRSGSALGSQSLVSV